MIRFLQTVLFAGSFLLLVCGPILADDQCRPEAGAQGMPSTTQLAMNECAKKIWLYEDRLLNESYARALKAHRGVELSAMRDMQRSWIKFRDKTCLFVIGGTWRGHNTMRPMVYHLCMHDMSKTQRGFLDGKLKQMCDQGIDSACAK